MSETIWFVLGAIGLLIAGAGLGYWIAQLGVGRQAAKAENVQKSFDEYRREVTEHFGRTAEHFRLIGQQYRELYEHMASGADSLCDRRATDGKLPFEPPTMIEPQADELSASEELPPLPRDYHDDVLAAEPEPVDAEPAEAEGLVPKDDDASRDSSAKEQPDEAKADIKADAETKRSERTYH